MKAPVKRVTVKVYDRYIDAWDCHGVLRQAGVGVKVVTKHAVQIHPEHIERAKEALLAEQKRRAEQPWPPRPHVISNEGSLGVQISDIDQMLAAGAIRPGGE